MPGTQAVVCSETGPGTRVLCTGVLQGGEVCSEGGGPQGLHQCPRCCGGAESGGQKADV